MRRQRLGVQGSLFLLPGSQVAWTVRTAVSYEDLPEMQVFWTVRTTVSCEDTLYILC